ncbi:hypothetical protein [Micromonospora deserti]|uniref:DNA-binding protein n=1 Tax=Micromonospora deserti TaxID=2070366 RepID=A0A2W2DM86_9ACTN|nr:hypothetical protein [Micromonospora deserti]PZF98246.1 hypothetical protein C1I99_13755 [Micromonospora deserti]
MTDEWIKHDGDHWGTARMIANHLGPDITEAMIRNWAARDGLPTAKMRDQRGRRQTRYPLSRAIGIEAEKFLSGRGRKRRLDERIMATA